MDLKIEALENIDAPLLPDDFWDGFWDAGGVIIPLAVMGAGGLALLIAT